VGLDLEGETVRQARISRGGVAYRPWRSLEAERALIGKALTEANAEIAAAAALQTARSHGDNGYKPELARRTLVRALLQAKSKSLTAGA